MARKKLFQLRAVAKNGVVRLSCYKSTNYFQNKQKENRFRAIRIWRKLVSDFDFKFDYSEYFDGLSCRNAALVFEGPLDAQNDRKFVITDDDVAPGNIYAYWVAAATGSPTGPVAVAVRDPEVWWSEETLNIGIDDLRRRYPDRVSVEEIGQTVRGRDLRAIHIGKGQTSVGFIGAVHAGESGAELMLPAFESLLRENADLLDEVSIDAVPVVNLDERQREAEGVPWYLRANANGVDLNRNFPAEWDTVEYGYGLDSSDVDSMSYRGPRAASEPETRAVMAFLEDRRPAVVYAFHALASICGPKFIAARCAQEDEAYVLQCRAFAQAYAVGMASEFDDDHSLKFACSSGSLPTWCCQELGVPAFDMEMLRDDEGIEQCVSGRTDQPLLQAYRRRHLGGMRRVMEGMSE